MKHEVVHEILHGDTSTRASADTCGGVPPIRVWAVSDVHSDASDNLAWVEGLRPEIYGHDVILVAGDISPNMAVIRRTLALFQRSFASVFYIPGNHCLWITDRGNGETDSMAKLRAVLKLCDELGVETLPRLMGAGKLLVVPMLSWHHQSFDSEPPLLGW